MDGGTNDRKQEPQVTQGQECQQQEVQGQQEVTGGNAQSMRNRS